MLQNNFPLQLKTKMFLVIKSLMQKSNDFGLDLSHLALPLGKCPWILFSKDDKQMYKNIFLLLSSLAFSLQIK